MNKIFKIPTTIVLLPNFASCMHAWKASWGPYNGSPSEREIILGNLNSFRGRVVDLFVVEL